MSSGPNPFPCGQPGQRPCPPTPAIKVNPGDVIEVEGQKYAIPEKYGQEGDNTQE